MSERQIDHAVLAEVAGAFDIPGACGELNVCGNGHINDTFVGEFTGNGRPRRCVFQRINVDVFHHPVELTDNVARVTAHLRSKIEAAGLDADRRTLTLLPALRSCEGSPFLVRDRDGGYWRCYKYIEDSTGFESIASADHAYEAAKAFGGFVAALADLEGPRLHETIPNFHNTPVRFEQFAASLAEADPARIEKARSEIDFVQARRSQASRLVDLLAAGKLPERIAHNDTKINNVLFDASGKGLCVIDLDTVMPSLVLYDFGDSVRLGANPAAEDERDLSRVELKLEMFEALAKGYIEGSGGMLTRAEKSELVFSAWLITLEIAVRFLGDYLAGDVYFRTSREGHNLDRCRTQLRMVALIEESRDEMQRIVDQL